MENETVIQIAEKLKPLALKQQEKHLQILGKRFDHFCRLPIDEKVEAISKMLDSTEELSEEDIFMIITTRLDVLSKLQNEKRILLMETLNEIIHGLPDDSGIIDKCAFLSAARHYIIIKEKLNERTKNKTV